MRQETLVATRAFARHDHNRNRDHAWCQASGQCDALERAGHGRSDRHQSHERTTEKEAHGEFESEHPGYRGAQDTFYVGNLKGVERVYQQTFIDT